MEIRSTRGAPHWAGMIAFVAGCGSTPSTVGGTPDLTSLATTDSATTPGDAATTGDLGGASLDLATSPGEDGGGDNRIAGSVGADPPFSTAATALWIGSPDDPATTVIYVFSKPVMCQQLARMGWDTRITDQTEILEMKSFGTVPNPYKVTLSMTPAPGEASVNYTLSSTMGTPNEVRSSAGTVTLKSLQAKAFATGSFDLDFGGGDKLAGAFNATFCAGGHEP